MAEKKSYSEEELNEMIAWFNNHANKLPKEMRWRTWKDLKFYTDKQGQMNGLRQVWGTPTYRYTWGGDKYWSLPIPIREIQMNPNMKQTPGWE